MKAVIPAAGLGTRFLPATKNQPKEMLPVVDKPAIQYVVEEAVASGITDILIITGRGKRAIEDHFDRNFELEAQLRERGEHGWLRQVRRIPEMADIHYLRQKEPLGLGHAIWCARNHIGDEPFAVLLGDDIVFSRTPCTRQLVRAQRRLGGAVIAVEKVAREKLSHYGVVKVARGTVGGLARVLDLVEKPTPNRAPSRLGVLGRYVLPPEIFDILGRLGPGKGGEIQLTDGLRELGRTVPIHALELDGRRFDLGNKLEWLKTNVEIALQRSEFGQPLAAYLRGLKTRPRKR